MDADSLVLPAAGDSLVLPAAGDSVVLPAEGGFDDQAAPLDPPALARLARQAAGRLGGWRNRAGGVTQLRSGIRLKAAEDHEVWLLCWPPGSSVTPHDHGASAGALVVVSGHLTETRWQDGRRTETALEPGRVVQVERGQVHDVVATGATAYSVHAYSPPLRSMTFFGDDGRTVLRTESVEDAPAHFVAH